MSQTTHTLGGAEAGDVGVQGSDFVGGLHQEHAVGRNVNAFAAGDNALQLRDQGGIRLAERLELIEERIDDVRAGEDAEQGESHRREPEPQPPATGKLADKKEEQHDAEAAKDVDERETLALIGKPAPPMLDAQTIGGARVLPVHIEWQAEQRGEQQEEKEEGKSLGPAIFREVDREVAHSGGDAQLQDQEENDDTPEAPPNSSATRTRYNA